MTTPIMLIFFAFFLFGSLCLMCIFRDKLDSPFINRLFTILTLAFYFSWTYAGSLLGWTKSGFLTMQNISPFVCTIVVILPLMRKPLRDFAYASIAYLSVGMSLALFLSPLANYLFEMKKEATFVYASEAACHLIMALYGFYLFLRGRVKVDLLDFKRAALFIYSAVGVGVVCNYFFKMSNFGMNMHGNYAIYSLKLFDNFGATLAAYLLGIFGVLCMGYIAGHFLTKLGNKKAETTIEPTEEAEPTEEPTAEAVCDVTEEIL